MALTVVVYHYIDPVKSLAPTGYDSIYGGAYVSDGKIAAVCGVLTANIPPTIDRVTFVVP